ncbi:MAG: chloride channel protein [Veillonella sp.]|nr:chloride channel protein [Veillonella sp.]
MAFDKRLIGLIIIVGFIAGLVGASYTHLLHGIQHFVYHYSSADHMSFGAAVARVSPVERLIPLIICGLIGGVGWVLIHRYGKGVVDIKTAVSGKMDMNPITTVLHATLQIITVGIGSPLGREVAPREASAGITTFLVKHFDIKQEDRQLLIACAAGAGLAAVYNSPLSAAIFTLETLLLTWNIRAMSAALICCGLATFVTRQAGVGDVIQYTMAQPSLITQGKLPSIHRSSPVMIPISIVAFTIIGALAMYFPEILGNGKAGNELTFANDITWTYALGLFGSKWVAVLLALAAGAYGGRITPSMMLGSTLAIVFGTFWSIAVAPISLGMAAFIGAVAFLGLAQKMPMTSCVFMLELTRFSVEMFFPIALTMGTALMVEQIVQAKLKTSK